MSDTFPQISKQALIDHFIKEGILTQERITSLLGEKRHEPSLNALELSVVKNNVMSKDTLLAHKGAIASTPTYPNNAHTTTKHLPEKIAQRTGALTIDRETPTVVMVEPTQANIDLVTDTLNTKFDIYLTTAAHFTELLRATYRGTAIKNLPPPPSLYQLLDAAVEKGASDIHLKVGVAPRLRIDGAMTPVPCQALDEQWMATTLSTLTPVRNQQELKTKLSTDYAYAFGTARFRVNTAHDTDGITTVMRRLPTTIPTCDNLSLPQPLRNFANLERGLVLVTGPTGSGKSTTLAAILNDVINTSARHVITLEDPVEFVFPTDRRSLVNQRELGTSFATFPDGIRDALRQDPDVMLVGELRDRETISAALELADTGHLVFATLHTNNAPRTVQRIVNTYPAEEQDAIRVQLSQLLRGCVSQTLLPRSTGKGRVAAFEILLPNPAVSTGLRKVDGANQLKQAMQTSVKSGMQTMEVALATLTHQGVVERSEAQFRAQDIDEYVRHLRHLEQTAVS